MNTLILLVGMGVGNPSPEPLHCAAPLAAKGQVKGGPSLVHTFELAHRGTGTLTITRVEAGCGCLRQSLSSHVLTPGQTAKLTLEVNTLTQPDGPNRWQIAVGYKLDNPGIPIRIGEILLQISATLSREVTVSPPQLAFSTTGKATQVIEVRDSRTKQLTVLKAATSSPHLTAEVGLRIAGKGQAITIKLSPDAPVGHRDEAVVLVTDDADYAELRVPVRVLKRPIGGIRASPESISLRFLPDQTELSTLIQLRAVDGKPIEIAGAESELPGVAVKHSTGATDVAVVRVTVAESASGTSGSCLVRVKFSRPSSQEIAIPVAWTRAMK
jgi:hypothetical protein